VKLFFLDLIQDGPKYRIRNHGCFSTYLWEANWWKPSVVACHAGLVWDSWNQLPWYGYDFFGPTIRGAHSPDEASISSSQKFWKFLLEILRIFQWNSIQLSVVFSGRYWDLRIISTLNLKKRQNENYFRSAFLLAIFTAINCTNFNKFLLIELIDENQWNSCFDTD
jgi:hypothetical protein